MKGTSMNRLLPLVAGVVFACGERPQECPWDYQDSLVAPANVGPGRCIGSLTQEEADIVCDWYVQRVGSVPFAPLRRDGYLYGYPCKSCSGLSCGSTKDFTLN